MSFDYFIPANIAETVKLLHEYQSDAKILAGGTDLILQLQNKEILPKYLIDISRLSPLKEIKLRDEFLVVGSLCTFSELENIFQVYPETAALAQAAAAVGSPQIRNQATIGGNLANASPAADSIPALLSLGAIVEIVSVRGTRRLALEEILGGIGNTGLKNDELIIAFLLPLKAGSVSAFYKLGRRNALAITRISMAVSLEFEDGTINAAAVALGAVGPSAYRLAAVEEMLTGREFALELWPDVQEKIAFEVAEVLGDRPSASYKRLAVKGVAGFVWQKLMNVSPGST